MSRSTLFLASLAGLLAFAADFIVINWKAAKIFPQINPAMKTARKESKSAAATRWGKSKAL
ncbi:hypothetical protein HYU18_03975 [Candidatus Woesearchaeota archaeon]|nr:hypothetical protein [Candidatus Woesearchaeota archaeon]